MYLSDLKTGMVIETKEGGFYLVLCTEKGTFFIRDNGWNNANAYNTDLTHTIHKEFNIITVYEIKLAQAFKYIFNIDNLTILWKRETTIDYNTYVGKICKFWDNNKNTQTIGIYRMFVPITAYPHMSFESSYKYCELLTKEELEKEGIKL